MAAFFFAGFADRAAALGLAATLADFLLVFFFFAAFAILEILLKKRVVRRTLTHPHALRTRILWRNVITVKRTLFAVALVCALLACSRLQPLTPDVLQQAEAKWMAHRPQFYRLTIEMSGDRVETGRFEVTVRGPGGHSWSDFGAPNPTVVLGRAIHLFSQTRVSSSPKATFNVGVIRGGTSVNSIPESASMRVDLRSSSASEIERLELELRRALEQGLQEEEARTPSGQNSHRRPQLSSEMVVIGDRPGGELDSNAQILQIARAVDAHLGNNAHVQRASTDANIPISMGREAIAIGAGGSGGGAHTLQEWFDTTGRELALERILLIVLCLAGTGRPGV